MSVGVVLLSQFVEKYSLGRTPGVSPANWRCRRLILTETTIGYYQDEAGEKEYLNGSTLSQPLSSSSNVRPANDVGLKFQCPLCAVSVLFAEPSPEVHPEVKRTSPHERPMLFALRLFENGVFTLLVRVRSRAVKDEWLAALWSALTKKSSRVQRVPSLAPPPPPSSSSQATFSSQHAPPETSSAQPPAEDSSASKPSINQDLLWRKKSVIFSRTGHRLDSLTFFPPLSYLHPLAFSFCVPLSLYCWFGVANKFCMWSNSVNDFCLLCFFVLFFCFFFSFSVFYGKTMCCVVILPFHLGKLVENRGTVRFSRNEVFLKKINAKIFIDLPEARLYPISDGQMNIHKTTNSFKNKRIQ